MKDYILYTIAYVILHHWEEECTCLDLTLTLEEFWKNWNYPVDQNSHSNYHLALLKLLALLMNCIVEYFS